MHALSHWGARPSCWLKLTHFTVQLGQARSVCAARLGCVISAHRVHTIAHSQVMALGGKEFFLVCLQLLICL